MCVCVCGGGGDLIRYFLNSDVHQLLSTQKPSAVFSCPSLIITHLEECVSNEADDQVLTHPSHCTRGVLCLVDGCEVKQIHVWLPLVIHLEGRGGGGEGEGRGGEKESGGEEEGSEGKGREGGRGGGRKGRRGGGGKEEGWRVEGKRRGGGEGRRREKGRG